MLYSQICHRCGIETPELKKHLLDIHHVQTKLKVAPRIRVSPIPRFRTIKCQKHKMKHITLSQLRACPLCVVHPIKDGKV